MSEAEDGRSGLVSPDDSEIHPIKQCLQDAGFSRDDQEWLIRVFERPDCFGDRSGDAVFKDGFASSFERVLPGVVDKLGEPDQTEKDRQLRLALLFGFLLGFGHGEKSEPNEKLDIPNEVIPEWVGEFQRHVVFCAKHLDWRKLVEIRDAHAFPFFDLIPFLFPEGVPLDQVANLDLLNPIRRPGWSSNDFRDPDQIEFWLIWRFRDNAERCDIISLNTLLQAFSSFPEDVLADKILGLLHAIGYAMNIAGLDSLNDGWRVVADELIPFMELLNEKEPELRRERASLLKAWWRLSVVIYYRSMGGLGAGLSDELRDRLVASAAKHMGMLRKVLRETPEDFAREDSTGEDVDDFYDKAFEVLCIFATPWRCLKSLLLAFTEMTVPAIASDLRYWPESDKEPPPHPYSRIPSWIGISMYPQNLRDELNRDPHLQGLREEFAKFCLERLKTKKNDTRTKSNVSDDADEEFVEPRRTWRQCYVQALTALRVNPGGRAHRTLFWLSKNDPDKNVREFARRAHRQIRHLNRNKPNLERGASPRRSLFLAFWWLRQAHLLTLGKEIDQNGAMRTRRTELHRTREKDDRLNWEV
ncbi:MAG: hypothetical protein F4Z86_08530 [Gemmatimonadetes bacterium]|nr:hypothetical protein [Gemmatimonadota bacterium]MYB56397.1 hypothetical protein [Gemmatimonadota bacterium]MYD59794.1 hypothetical protein [Gemmatimonadota bacterium]